MPRLEGEPRISRRKALKLGIFAAAGGYTTWSYLYKPPQTELRKQYHEAYGRWEESYKALKETGGIVDEGFPILRAAQYDPSNPHTQEFYDAKREVNDLGRRIGDDEYPIDRIQSVGTYLGPIVTIVAGANLIEKEPVSVSPEIKQGTKAEQKPLIF